MAKSMKILTAELRKMAPGRPQGGAGSRPKKQSRSCTLGNGATARCSGKDSESLGPRSPSSAYTLPCHLAASLWEAPLISMSLVFSTSMRSWGSAVPGYSSDALAFRGIIISIFSLQQLPCFHASRDFLSLPPTQSHADENRFIPASCNVALP